MIQVGSIVKCIDPVDTTLIEGDEYTVMQIT